MALLGVWRMSLARCLARRSIMLSLRPYRAQATVNVDFNLEQAWPQETDRQQFYYLEREARKLEELAWSDEIMSQLSSQFAIPVEALRAEKLLLSQPPRRAGISMLMTMTRRLPKSLLPHGLKRLPSKCSLKFKQVTLASF